MRMAIKGKSAGIIIGFVFVFVLSGLCFYISVVAVYAGETPVSYFENREQLQESQVWHGGWVPSVIPQSASQIYEAHNLDVNWVRLKFLFSVDDKFYEDERFVPLDSVTLPELSNHTQYDWWDLDKNSGKCKFYTFYSHSGDEAPAGFWGIYSQTGTAYFWDK